MSFDTLTRAAVESKKKRTDEERRDAKAFDSADHSQRRKAQMPPTQTELNRARKVNEEAAKVNFKSYTPRDIQRLKRQCRKFKEYVGFKDRLKHFQLPAANAPGQDWEECLADMRSELGQSKAHQRFDKMWGYGLMLTELASVKYPDMFMGVNLVSPVRLSEVGTSPQFLESIDDERAELVIVHDWLFSSSVYSRMAEKVFEVIQATAQQNAQANAVMNAKAKFAGLSKPAQTS